VTAKLSEAPAVYCPKEKKNVPIWYCTGSFVQARPTCPNLIEATIERGKKASVKCKLTMKNSYPALFIVKLDIIKAILENPEWSDRWNKANTIMEMQEVAVAYCRAHNIPVI
jgi:hypothetical protein